MPGIKTKPVPGLISNLLPGPDIALDKPIPIFTLLSPSIILLLCVTIAFAPIAVALVRIPEETFAPIPSAVLLLPVVTLNKALFPTEVLPLPVVFELSEETPAAVLSFP